MNESMNETKKQKTCCECNNIIPENINNSEIKKCICNNLICTNCYERHKIRANKSPDFYNQYIGVCDTCIWFDIS